ncbi:hypothetical protein K469DRAFT_696650 [Zopfia rhizophila CBS 207.26]|uniref:Uncharacterized protein n=1 Tax=Zopfia rhizophila CBS 207.26 TaxID=1314779 RepID=A0A6A6DDE2_9PEZI|nr:hypothetical protein K469DRAFT_696650 [Zopfia rhizophila CBS 207.26]
MAQAPALEHFDEAVARSTNLTAFVHEPGFLFDSRWGSRWRPLCLGLDGVILYTTENEDEDVEALQLSYILRALGWANYFNRKLRSISFYVSGRAFWGAERLRCLWAGEGHHRMRDLQRIYGDVAEVDRQARFDEDRESHF